MPRSRLIALLLAAVMAAATPAAAQRVLGMGDDGSTLPSGMLRLTFGGLWDRANERYDADGKLHVLGSSATTASWNGRYDSRLAAATPLVSTLSGLSSFDASLGALTIARRDAAADAAVGVALGLTTRIMLGVRLNIASHAIEPNVVINPGRTEGTMGFNPAWTNTAAANRNALVLTQLDSAVAQLSRRVTQCVATPASAGCATLLPNVSTAQSLLANATSFATALNQLYGGRKGSAGLPFVPVSNGAAQQAINQRLLGYRDQFVALGNSALGTLGPTGGAVFSQTDVATLLGDSLYGYQLRPLRAVHAYGPGEATVYLKARLFETTGEDAEAIRGFAVRQSASVAVRLSGGSKPLADEPFAPVTGTGSGGVAVQSFTDIWYGNRFSASVVLGFDQGQPASYAARVAAASAPSVGGVAFPFVMRVRELQLSRTPGSRVDLSVTPRVALTGNLWLGATWQMAQQASDTWTTMSSPVGSFGDALVSSTDVQTWAAGTDWSEQRLAVGGTYSTVAAEREGRARLAFDVTYEHQQTMTGRGWRVPHLTADVLTVRWYPRAWGRKRPSRPAKK